MKQGFFTVTEISPAARDVYRLRLSGDTGAMSRAGQFVNVAVPGMYLRRPISVCDWDEDTLTLVFKAVGQGTERLSHLQPGERLDLLTGLGNGFDLERVGKKPLMAGGGVGAPPLYRAVKELVAGGASPTVVLGFASAADALLVEDFAALGVPVVVATADGTRGVHGFVTDALAGLSFDSILACGPIPMLRALCERTDCPAQLSFEERMACGFGACMGCSRLTKNGAKRICKDGPVLDREELIW